MSPSSSSSSLSTLAAAAEAGASEETGAAEANAVGFFMNSLICNNIVKLI